MDISISMFFEKMPQALPLFQLFAEKVLKEWPSVRVTVKKSQISFSEKHNFAFAWQPIRKMKNRPAIYLIVSFGLSRIIQAPGEIDPELMSWIREAHDLAVVL